MQAYRSDRVVRVLTTLVTIAYFGLWMGAVVVLAGIPALKALSGDDPVWSWGLPVPVVLDLDETVLTRWGSARLEVEDVRGSLRLPIAMLPWWLFAVLWTHAATAFVLMLLLLSHLRRIFQRVRDGAPFDAGNAIRMRWVGLLLLALARLNGVAEFVTSVAVRSGLASGALTVPRGFHVDVPVVVGALVLIALAEIFHRGAVLEREQSLVV